MSYEEESSLREGFSSYLKHYRKNIHHWTQKELADKIELVDQNDPDLETAQKAVLDRGTISKLANSFNWTELKKKNSLMLLG